LVDQAKRRMMRVFRVIIHTAAFCRADQYRVTHGQAAAPSPRVAEPWHALRGCHGSAWRFQVTHLSRRISAYMPSAGTYTKRYRIPYRPRKQTSTGEPLTHGGSDPVWRAADVVMRSTLRNRYPTKRFDRSLNIELRESRVTGQHAAGLQASLLSPVESGVFDA